MLYALPPSVRRGLLALAAAALFAAPAAGQTTTFFTSNGFEPGTFNPGQITGQQGFQVVGSAPAATVQTNRVFAGTQALQINGPTMTDTGSTFGHTNFWYKPYAWDPSQQLVSPLGTPFLQVGFKVWTQGLVNPGNDIPLAGVYLEGWRQGTILGIPVLEQRAISPIMVNGTNGVTVFTTQAVGGSTQALQTASGILPRETWNELFTEFNFSTQTFRVYKVGQTDPLEFTRTGDGTVLIEPIVDVPFRNSNLAPSNPNYNTVSIAEIGFLAAMVTTDGLTFTAPGNNMFFDDLLVTRSATSQVPVPEPGFVLAAAGLAGLAGWKLRRRKAASS